MYLLVYWIVRKKWKIRALHRSSNQTVSEAIGIDNSAAKNGCVEHCVIPETVQLLDLCML